jgi:tetratricopeptide (TPR) repeat protein
MISLRTYSRVLAVAAALVLVSACSQDNVRPEAASTTTSPQISVDDSIEQMFTQALTHLKQEEYDEGIVLLETLTAKETRLTAPFVNLGIAYSRTGNTRKAEYNFSRALRLDAGHAVANNELGLLYRKTGRFNAAKSAYMNALVAHPDYLPVRKNLGILCELYLHDLDCALEQYRAYIQYAPEEQTVARWALELEQRTQ